MPHLDLLLPAVSDNDTRMVSPMPSASSTPNATADLMVPWNSWPGLGHPEMQRVVALLGPTAGTP